MTEDKSLARRAKDAPDNRRILVLNEFGDDLGEQATFAGFVRVLSDAADRAALDITLDQSSLRAFPFRESTIATVNESYDLLIVAGGPVIAPRAEGETASGWAFDIPEDLLPRLTTPFAVYAAGYERSPLSRHRFADETASHLGQTVARAAHFSVREARSLEMMRSRFDVVSGVRLAPDCAVHVAPVNVEIPGMPCDRPLLAVSLEMHTMEEQLSGRFGERFETLMTELCATLSDRARRGFHIVYAPLRLMQQDSEAGRLLAASLPAGSITLLNDALPALYRTPTLDGPSVLSGVFSRCDAIIAQPVSTIVLAASVGVPVVTLAASPSRRWLHEAHGMPPSLYLDLTRFTEATSRGRMTAALEDASSDRVAIRDAALERHRALVRSGEAEMQHLLDETIVERPSCSPSVRANLGASF